MARPGITPLPVATGELSLRRDPDAGNAWFVDLDGRRQSHVDLDDPTRLRLSYVRRIGHVLDLLPPPGAPLDVLHLGGGGLTLPRYVAVTRPRSRQRVFEVDPLLTAHIRDALPLDPRWRIRVRDIDAGEGLATLAQASVDVVISDAYRDGVVPAHLAPATLAEDMVRVLRPGGTIAVNVIDAMMARSAIAALSARLQTVIAILDRARRVTGGNVVVAASDAPLDLSALRARVAADPVPGRVATGG